MIRRIPLPSADAVWAKAPRCDDSPLRRPQIVGSSQVDVESLTGRFREVFVVHLEGERQPAPELSGRDLRLAADEECTDVASRDNQLQVLGNRPMQLVDFHFKPTSTRCRRRPDPACRDRWNRLTLLGVGQPCEPQLLKSTLP